MLFPNWYVHWLGDLDYRIDNNGISGDVVYGSNDKCDCENYVHSKLEEYYLAEEQI